MATAGPERPEAARPGRNLLSVLPLGPATPTEPGESPAAARRGASTMRASPGSPSSPFRSG